jgi:hypothetical protein
MLSNIIEREAIAMKEEICEVIHRGLIGVIFEIDSNIVIYAISSHLLVHLNLVF